MNWRDQREASETDPFQRGEKDLSRNLNYFPPSLCGFKINKSTRQPWAPSSLSRLLSSFPKSRGVSYPPPGKTIQIIRAAAFFNPQWKLGHRQKHTAMSGRKWRIMWSSRRMKDGDQKRKTGERRDGRDTGGDEGERGERKLVGAREDWTATSNNRAEQLSARWRC